MIFFWASKFTLPKFVYHSLPALFTAYLNIFSSSFFAREIPTSVLLIGTLFIDLGWIGASSRSCFEPSAGLIWMLEGAFLCFFWLWETVLGTVICALVRCTLLITGVGTCGWADGSADPLWLQRDEVIVGELVCQQISEGLLGRLPLAVRSKCDPFYLCFHR